MWVLLVYLAVSRLLSAIATYVREKQSFNTNSDTDNVLYFVQLFGLTGSLFMFLFSLFSLFVHLFRPYSRKYMDMLCNGVASYMSVKKISKNIFLINNKSMFGIRKFQLIRTRRDTK